jgi:CRP-like cAMP-binding protein
VKTYWTADLPARARRTDPDTSHDAAEDVEREGHASRQREACLRVVRDTPGLTAAEIAQAAGLERHAPSRRLPELRDMGLVRNLDDRTCTVTRRLSMTWWPVGEARE